MTDHDEFYENVPEFAQYIFGIPSVDKFIARCNKYNKTYYISFLVELEERALELN